MNTNPEISGSVLSIKSISCVIRLPAVPNCFPWAGVGLLQNKSRGWSCRESSLVGGTGGPPLTLRSGD